MNVYIRIPMAFLLTAAVGGCSAVRPENGAMDPDEADVLQSVLAPLGSAVLLSEPSCERTDKPDIPLFDDDADLLDPARLFPMGVYVPSTRAGDDSPMFQIPALRKAELYWRKKVGQRVTADTVIRDFPHDDEEAASCTLYLLTASRNVRALQFVRQGTLSANPVMREAVLTPVQQLFFPSPGPQLRKEDLRAFLDEAIAQQAVTARQVARWEIWTQMRQADVDDTVNASLVRDFIDRNYGPLVPFQAKDIARLNDRVRVENLGRFNDTEGQFSWSVFWERYPKGTALVTASRVGFNDTRDCALLYVSTGTGPLSGCGELLLLKRTGGKWLCYASLSSWIA
jgi:hypothetical protein